MSDETKVNKPVQPQLRVEEPAEAAAQKSSKMPWIVLGVVVVVIIVLGVLFGGKLFGTKGSTAGKSSGYQAVFLTNGQVYFGKIDNMGREYVTLKDIYYLQVVQQEALQGSQQQAQQQPQISLVKLGSELHGPVDEMHISKTQILFYEDLKTEGKVVEAIQSYKANPQGSAQQQAPAQQQIPAAQQLQQQAPAQQQVPPAGQ